VTFSTTNWNTWQTLSVVGVDDNEGAFRISEVGFLYESIDWYDRVVCEDCSTLATPTSYVKPDGSRRLPTAQNEAEVACVRMSGHLASIHSEADNTAAMAAGGADSYIDSHDIFTEVGCAGDGNSADDHSQGFIWTDGTMVEYTNWNGGEPNDWNGSAAGGANCDQATDGAGGEDCTLMRGDSKWNDKGCGGAAAYPWDLSTCEHRQGRGLPAHGGGRDRLRSHGWRHRSLDRRRLRLDPGRALHGHQTYTFGWKWNGGDLRRVRRLRRLHSHRLCLELNSENLCPSI
jgi:hypothetical protein